MIKNLQLRKRASSGDDFRYYKEFDNHEMVIALTDNKSGLKAYIAIHNTNLGPASGGTRLKAYASHKEAIKDALNLSKAMSYKCALAALPFGGGKAVIVASPDMNRSAILEAYARMIEKLNGLYMTGTDVGLTDEDVTFMSNYTSRVLGVGGDRAHLSTASTAALGVFYAMKAALKELYGDSDIKGRSVAIKGVGKLGGALARLIHEAGGALAVADLNHDAALNLATSLPNVEVVAPSEIHKQVVDIYAPCALGNEFTPVIIKQLRCKAVAGGANNQLPTAKAGDDLFKKKILYVPDYVANAGGLIFVSDELEKDGFQADRVLARTKNIEDIVADIFSRSKAQQQPTHRIADMIAQERIEKGHL